MGDTVDTITDRTPTLPVAPDPEALALEQQCAASREAERREQAARFAGYLTPPRRALAVFEESGIGKLSVDWAAHSVRVEVASNARLPEVTQKLAPGVRWRGMGTRGGMLAMWTVFEAWEIKVIVPKEA
jgi:hypothetical protein